MSQPLLRVDGLTIGYTGRSGRVNQVVRNVTLTIERGQTLGLVGESGCGKSTLALALLGYLREGSRVLGGTVRFGGQDLFALPADALQEVRGGQIALVPQNAGQSLTPTMRIGAQIVESLTVHHHLDQAQAHAVAVDLLGQVRLPNPAAMAQRYPHELSGGQQQRVAIAMALAGEPDLLVLDEPTTGLDVTTQAHILDLLEEIRTHSNVAMVYVSHDLGVIARVSDRLAVMYAGEIVETGAAVTLFAQPHHPYTRGLLASVPRLSEGGLPQALPGQPPAPSEQISGCSFAPRCAFADERCTAVAPPLETAGGSLEPHQVRCHYWPRVVATEPVRQVRVERNGAGPGAMQSPLILLDGVSITYARTGLGALWRKLRGQPEPPATVSDITLTIQRGETLALVGESGSGKSTLARTVAGLQPKLSGQSRLGESDLTPPVERRSPELRRAIQIIFQNPDASLNPRQTVSQIVERPLWLFFGLPRAERRARAVALLERMRLGAHYLERYPGQLSGGEKQRVAIARAFAAEPDLVLCDEVVSALDVSVQAAVLELLSNLQRERGVTYLFIAHDLAVVRAIADRVAVLYQGRLCEVGTVTQVYTPPFHPYTETLLAAVPEPIPGKRARLLDKDLPIAAPPPRGCPFQQRCPRRLGSICDEETPPWQLSPTGHAIRCHIPLDGLHEPLIDLPELAAAVSEMS
ncbi:MAG: ABC transporter ATP-binding protein [Chloroflexi bacterium]|nr:MAG: ABC transporter ATP-binding protein [Chloroflexota bacterium]